MACTFPSAGNIVSEQQLNTFGMALNCAGASLDTVHDSLNCACTMLLMASLYWTIIDPEPASKCVGCVGGVGAAAAVKVADFGVIAIRVGITALLATEMAYSANKTSEKLSQLQRNQQKDNNGNHESFDNGNIEGKILSHSQKKGVSSLQKNIAEHKAKLETYEKDPFSFDNKGFLKKAPNQMVQDRIIERRIAHLQKEIRVFEDNILRITRGE